MCRPGFLSKQVGVDASWFQTGTYKDRVHTMIVFFQARIFLLDRGLSSRQKELSTAGLAMFKRVNAASRLETPRTSWTYEWYSFALQQRSACSAVHRLAEFILNASLVLCIWVFSRDSVLMTTAVACQAQCKNDLPAIGEALWRKHPRWKQGKHPESMDYSVNTSSLSPRFHQLQL